MPRVTVLQLDTRFPRVPGDVGCPETYTEPPQILTIPGATVARIVTPAPEGIDIAPFEAALARATGDVVVTSCGFLAPFQNRLAGRTDRPFIASSLSALQRLDVPPANLLILTFDASSLTPAHLGGRPDYLASVVGLPPDMHLRQVIAQGLGKLDTDRSARDVVALARSALRPHHRHILLECTNLPPYKAALREATGLPVTDILTLIEDAAPGSIRPEFH